MRPSQEPTRKHRWLARILFVPPAMALGALIGGSIAGRLMTRPADGWEQIGQFLGGLMIGAVAGLVLATVLATALEPRTLLRAAAAALAAAALLFAALYLTRPRPRSAHPSASVSSPVAIAPAESPTPTEAIAAPPSIVDADGDMLPEELEAGSTVPPPAGVVPPRP